MRFILDTNSCIDFARGRSASLLRRMKERRRDGLVMSAISYAELSVGAREHSEGPDREHLETLVRIVRVVPFDAVAARAYGRLVREHGVKRHDFDRLIAAQALSLDVTLVTNNERHFNGIAGLRVENWTR
ncbi:type II toxin-antitoxin system VapC family toxin [Sphingomonas bacterium]|uniref:type II toxin-antitoxin system VapC family toxin n=1 Tax=Sphingomonas bacterium TaxID=1895847 RepID=UPI0015755927|nr:type II toxin-antitoxin system VapC family toxin [Sphingomonas bacterium]